MDIPAEETQGEEAKTTKRQQLSAKEQMASCAKSVVIGSAFVAGAIIVFGALDLYGKITWDYLKDVVSLGGTSLIFPCVTGLLSAALAAWSVCTIENNNVKPAPMIAIALLGLFMWVICFGAANAFAFDEDYPEFEGFVLWLYVAMYIPILVCVVGFLAVLEAVSRD